MLLARPNRSTVARDGALIVAASILIWSTFPGHQFLHVSMVFVLTFVIPWYFILHLGRARSAAGICVALSSTAYLIWGSVFLFRSTPPWIYMDMRHLRWNWVAIAIVYVLVLANSLSPWKPRSRSLGVWRTSAGDEARRWRASPVVGWLSFVLGVVVAACMICLWSGWLTVVGLVALAFLALVGLWRSRGAMRRSRSMSRIIRAIPGVLVGLTIGLAWNWLGWISAAAVATLLVGGVALRSPNALIGRRARIAVLAALWTFAVSTQFVQPLRPRFPGSWYKPRRVVAHIPSPSQPSEKR